MCEIAPTVFGLPVIVPAPGEYVAMGAARQAAWCLSGAVMPPVVAPTTTRTFNGDLNEELVERYAAAVASASDTQAG